MKPAAGATATTAPAQPDNGTAAPQYWEDEAVQDSEAKRREAIEN